LEKPVSPPLSQSISAIAAIDTEFLNSQKHKHVIIDVDGTSSLIYPYLNYKTDTNTIIQHRLIWQLNGPEAYASLLRNGYLQSPHWRVRHVHFAGDIIQRSQEVITFIDHNGIPYRTQNILAQSIAGAHLSEAEARVIAHNHLQHIFVDNKETKEIEAIAQKQPNRTDWVFRIDVLENILVHGQTRLQITIAGNQVVDAFRYVYIPEETSRKEEQKLNTLLILIMIGKLLFYILLILALAVGIKNIPFHAFPYKFFLCMFALVFIANGMNNFNQWHIIIAQFNTSEPFELQKIRTLGNLFLGGFLQAGLSLFLTYALKTPLVRYIPSFSK
jgi:hypothetical protein